VGLADGWALDIGQRLPSGGWPSRLRHAVADGWARWRGRPVDERRLLAVALAAEDAQRLHHLFRPETKILVAGAQLAQRVAELSRAAATSRCDVHRGRAVPSEGAVFGKPRSDGSATLRCDVHRGRAAPSEGAISANGVPTAPRLLGAMCASRTRRAGRPFRGTDRTSEAL
jgi:hypothetical protein